MNTSQFEHKPDEVDHWRLNRIGAPIVGIGLSTASTSWILMPRLNRGLAFWLKLAASSTGAATWWGR